VADQRFPRAARLLAKRDFDAAFEAASRFRSAHFRVNVRATGAPARLGLAIAKRVVALASARNRIKRHAREVFRPLRAELAGHDIVVSVHASPVALDGAALKRELETLFRRSVAR